MVIAQDKRAEAIIKRPAPVNPPNGEREPQNEYCLPKLI
jgi:hypothetical protein